MYVSISRSLGSLFGGAPVSLQQEVKGHTVILNAERHAWLFEVGVRRGFKNTIQTLQQRRRRWTLIEWHQEQRTKWKNVSSAQVVNVDLADAEYSLDLRLSICR